MSFKDIVRNSDVSELLDILKQLPLCAVEFVRSMGMTYSIVVSYFLAGVRNINGSLPDPTDDPELNALLCHCYYWEVRNLDSAKTGLSPLQDRLHKQKY